MRTSRCGTTGTPVIVPYTQQDVTDWAVQFARCYETAGITNRDRIHITPGHGLWTAGIGFQLGAERLGAMTIPMGPGNTEKQLRMMQDLKSTVLCATSSYALLLAEEIAERGIRDRICLRKGVIGSERWGDKMRQRIAGELGVGSLTGFMSYVLLIMNSLMMISNVFLLLTRALTSVGRIAGVLDEEPFIANPAGDLAIAAPADGSIEFRDVSFKYRADAAEDVLEHIDLRIESGSTVGILGGTGSGKSSLVQLIARLYDATEGAVLVGGRDVRDYDLATLRDAVGIVLQKNVLFTGTVRENLQWGNPQASDDELLAACRAACVDEFLDRIGGLDGELGQGGAGVSGGQKQRLCIARTLLKHPRVLIFDDSTSAVDMATDAKIREHIARISDTTVLIIAQRIASVMDADRIVVLDDGRVHGVGTHEELLAGDNIYQEIYASQMEFARNADAGDGSDDGCANDPFSSVACGSPLEGGERHA